MQLASEDVGPLWITGLRRPGLTVVDRERLPSLPSLLTPSPAEGAMDALDEVLRHAHVVLDVVAAVGAAALIERCSPRVPHPMSTSQESR